MSSPPAAAAEDAEEKPDSSEQKLSERGVSTLHELVKCPVCLDRLEKPKMLPCQHTFCLRCVQNCVVVGGDTSHVRCAQCRAQVALPKEGVSALPVNIYLQSMLDWLQSNQLGNISVRCSACQTVCDVTACHHCSSGFCRPCMERHVEELCRQLHYIRDQLDVTKDKLRLRIKDFQESCTEVKAAVRRETQERVEKALDQERQLLEEVDAMCARQESTWMGSVEKLEATEKGLQEAIVKGFGDVGQAPEKVALFLKSHSQASATLEEVAQNEYLSIIFDSKAFSISSETSPKAVVHDGEDESKDSEDTSTPLPTPDAGLQAKIANAHSRFFRSRSFSVKSRLGVGLLQRPSGIAVSPWSSEIFVVSMDNNRVHVFDLTSGRFRRSFGSAAEFLCPFGIALSPPDRHILVTDKWKHCIHVFDRHGRFVRQIGTKGRAPAQFRSPEAICVDHSGRIYICDTCNNRIQVLDKDGIFLREIGSSDGGSGKRRSVFNDPGGIAVSRDGQRVVICDFGNHRVHVFTPDGGHVLTFGQKGSLKGQFINPESVAIDRHGFIFIGDSGNGRVQICRPDGRFVRAFGNKGSHGGQFSWISGIAVTDQYDVVVSDFKNHCVQIF